ncbi:MAG TPA: polysaccharide biosynthesis tyrosine autokinase [Armatimonadota bacterium]|jgi:capsular exopolysaccharide synthesis family protein
MDFWRAYRVLARRIWLIVAMVILTTGVVSGGIYLFARKFDGQTAVGPSDQAVRRAVNAGNDDRNQATITDDMRLGEARRIADEISDPGNAQIAVYYLAGAPIAREAVVRAMSGKPIGTPGQAPDYDTVTKAVRAAQARMTSDEIRAAVRASGIPDAVWADFIYLDDKLTANNISRDFLSTARLAETGSELSRNIEVTVLNSRDITVGVRDRDARLAEILANALTAAYKFAYDNQNHSAAASSLRFYTEQERAALARYTFARQRLANFRQTHKETFLPDQVSAAVRKNDQARNDLDSITATLKDADAQIAAKKARLAGLSPQLRHETKAENPEAGVLRAKINEIRADIAQKSGTWTDKNPEMVRLKDQLSSLEARYKNVNGKLIATVTYDENPEYRATGQDIAKLQQSRNGMAARLATLNQVMAKTVATISALPEASTQAQMLSGDFASAAERMQEVSRRLNQARDELQQADASGALQVRYWAGLPPGTPEHPESPAREGAAKRNAALMVAAFILSLVGSAAIVLALDFLDTSIKAPMDVERMLGDHVTGIVPRLEGSQKGMLAQVTHRLPGSPHAESYRFLGTDILLSAQGDQPYKTIMVATAKPGQGGTSTICNLAITLAQAGQTVALVDADLRRPSLHRVFGLPNVDGLSTILENGKLPSDVLQRTEIDNLYVMCGGPAAENAWKLLRSPKMKDVIADLSRDFDFVLFDTPSAVVFADAATLATMVDGVLLVVRAHEAPSGSELQVKNLLNKTKARIVGVVLNDVPAAQVDSARYFSHYYAPGVLPEEAASAAARPALPRKGSDDEI